VQTLVSAIFLDKHGNCGGHRQALLMFHKPRQSAFFQKVFSTNSPIGLVLRYRWPVQSQNLPYTGSNAVRPCKLGESLAKWRGWSVCIDSKQAHNLSDLTLVY